MNWLTNIWETYNKGLKYDKLESDWFDILEANRNLYKEQKQFTKAIFDLENENLLLYKQIEELEAKSDDKLKEYWYNKYPKLKSFKYNGTNVIDYCTKNNSEVMTVTGKDIDTIANNSLKKVATYMRYVADPKEHWQSANETVKRKLGDCEDGAILMYNIMVASGVPAWRIRVNAGDVSYGNSTTGHAYITYFREKDNTWYVMDWCYWFNESVDFKKKWSDAKKYFGIWWSFNSDYVWMKPDWKDNVPKDL